MADAGHEKTEKMLRTIEKRLDRIYGQALKESQEKLAHYLEVHERKSQEMLGKLNRGEITKAEYEKWAKSEMLTGKKYESLVETLAADYANTDKIAMSIVNGYTPEAYAINRNFAAFQIEQAGVPMGTTFTLYDRHTVENLVRDKQVLLPKPKVDIPKDQRWNKQHIRSAITQGVLQGESIPKIAKRLENVVGMDHAAAIRNARTAITGAQNKGRIASYRDARKMGIKVMNEWLATHDGRTRESHLQVEGERVEEGEEFSNGCEYPGDPDGPPEEVYNCRCTLIPYLPDYDEVPLHDLDESDFEKWESGLTTVPDYTDTEAKSLQQYTRSSYSGINSYLRGEEFFKSEYVEQIVDGIDSAMEKSKLPKEVTVFRGASDADLIGMFGSGLRRSWFEKADNLRSLEGKTGVFKSYLSTSVGELQSQFSRGLEWTFIADKGTHAVDLRNISVQSSENELLFDRNSKIEILKVNVNEDEEGYIYGTIKILARIVKH